MKKFLATALAGTMLVSATAAASAQPYRGHGYVRYDRGYHRHDNTGAMIGLGIGLFALGAIIASSQNHDRDRYYAPPPPPPPYRYGSDGYYYGR
jgi:opacity protein-like surface antigen